MKEKERGKREERQGEGETAREGGRLRKREIEEKREAGVRESERMSKEKTEKDREREAYFGMGR